MNPYYVKYNINLQKMTITKVLLFSLLGFAYANAQTTNDLQNQGLNVITTAVPLMGVTPDSRHGALGDAGVAATADANSNHWNAAAIPFAENDMALALTYTPWLRTLIPDINLSYIAGYKKLDDKQALGGSLRYFSLGSITFTDNTGNVIRDAKPNELAVDVSYSRKFAENFSGGLALRYIRSDLTNGITTAAGTATRAGNAVAGDISFYYIKPDVPLGKNLADLTFGLNISNIGSKISYTQNGQRDFLPCNFRLGSALKLKVDEYSALTFMADINKLLVPTPDSNSNVSQVSPAGALFSSWGDASFKEEMKEIAWSVATEYTYQNLFALRGGYFHESPVKGNRQYFTFGAGLKYKSLGIDFSYLLPTRQKNPLENTIRVTLRFEFAKK